MHTGMRFYLTTFLNDPREARAGKGREAALLPRGAGFSSPSSSTPFIRFIAAFLAWIIIVLNVNRSRFLKDFFKRSW